MSDLETLIDLAEGGQAEPLYLIAGDRVVSEPAGSRLGERIAEQVGCEVEVAKRPEDLSEILADLVTYSLFFSGKVVVATETAVLADRGAAAALIDEAAEALPVPSGDEELSGSQRRAANRLFRTFRLLDLDPYQGSPQDALEQLPGWVLQGHKKPQQKGRRRSKAQVSKLRGELVALLQSARAAEIVGSADDALDGLADILRRGLPDGHHLILTETSVAKDHPLVAALSARGGFLQLAQVTSGRKGWEGLGELSAELARETGVEIQGDALAELGRRTIRQSGTFARSGDAASAESSARFAAEYRKLAVLCTDGSISLRWVEETIADRGQQDVWAVLDAIGSKGPREAAAVVSRYLRVAEDLIAARLSLWSMIAAFCRQLTTIGGALRAGTVTGGEQNYRRFQNNIAPKLQAALRSGAPSPVASLHPYRLHRAYLAASRMPRADLARLPARVLATETMLKGDSSAPDTALTAFAARLAAALAG